MSVSVTVYTGLTVDGYCIKIAGMHITRKWKQRVEPRLVQQQQQQLTMTLLLTAVVNRVCNAIHCLLTVLLYCSGWMSDE